MWLYTVFMLKICVYQYVVVQINADQIMSFGGSTELCALCTLGNVGRVDTKAFSKGIMTLIQSQLGIPGDRLVK